MWATLTTQYAKKIPKGIELGRMGLCSEDSRTTKYESTCSSTNEDLATISASVDLLNYAEESY
jgi:hypothetical protein